MIFNYETKERIFHLWDEYMYYLDLLSHKHPTKEFIMALIQIQLEIQPMFGEQMELCYGIWV